MKWIKWPGQALEGEALQSLVSRTFTGLFDHKLGLRVLTNLKLYSILTDRLSYVPCHYDVIYVKLKLKFRTSFRKSDVSHDKLYLWTVTMTESDSTMQNLGGQEWQQKLYQNRCCFLLIQAGIVFLKITCVLQALCGKFTVITFFHEDIIDYICVFSVKGKMIDSA